MERLTIGTRPLQYRISFPKESPSTVRKAVFVSTTIIAKSLRYAYSSNSSPACRVPASSRAMVNGVELVRLRLLVVVASAIRFITLLYSSSCDGS